ncbi:hypothetical protein HK097_006932 [Rhizophlyctis rosea]|uniref:Uncharacterized protein n=1 Tax=Rhizophlyctis rosea TaxID=64517 RepID=A0AAD5X9M5_9FUNG|nr:hypothetical protein HK097_006932 [Rhizophlyctis rosea]
MRLNPDDHILDVVANFEMDPRAADDTPLDASADKWRNTPSQPWKFVLKRGNLLPGHKWTDDEDLRYTYQQVCQEFWRFKNATATDMIQVASESREPYCPPDDIPEMEKLIAAKNMEATIQAALKWPMYFCVMFPVQERHFNIPQAELIVDHHGIHVVDIGDFSKVELTCKYDDAEVGPCAEGYINLGLNGVEYQFITKV